MAQANPPWITPATRTPGDVPVFHPVEEGIGPSLPASIERLTALPRIDLPALVGLLDGSGVNAHRSASPDLQAQVIQAMRRPITSVIVHVLDAEPELALNAAAAATWPVELCAGSAILAGACRARALLVVPEASPSWLMGALKAPVRTARLNVVPASGLYPQSDPTLLLHTLLRRRLRPGRLPTDQGVILLDALAAIELGRLFLDRSIVFPVPLLVHEVSRRCVHWLLVRPGSKLRDMLDSQGVDLQGRRLLQGDVLRDRSCQPDDPIEFGERVIHVLPDVDPVSPQACVRCGWCIDACPTRLHPAGVLQAIQQDDIGLAERQGIEACIECGICTYVCPSHLPLMQCIRGFRQTCANRTSGASAESTALA